MITMNTPGWVGGMLHQPKNFLTSTKTSLSCSFKGLVISSTYGVVGVSGHCPDATFRCRMDDVCSMGI